MRRAQPRHPSSWWWAIGIPTVLLGALTIAVATRWAPAMAVDSAVATRAYDLSAGHRVWIGILQGVARVGDPLILRSIGLATAAVLLWRRHLRVGGWLVVVTAADWLLGPAAKLLLHRPRPHWAEPLVSIGGYSFPSGHAAGGGYFAAAGVITSLLLLPRGRLRRLVCAGFVTVGVVVGLDRILLGVHYATDVLGGWALGVLVVVLGWALLLRLTPEEPGPVIGTSGRRPSRVAVVLNPVKVADVTIFRSRVDASAAVHGWQPPLWFETTPEDPGPGMAEAALAAGAEMVLVAGGDGTVREVCGELARTGVAVGIVPLGTGNLLARNLGLPLHPYDAVEVAMSGQDRAVDVVALAGDDLDEGCFMVMAGLGLDAAIMAGAPDELKARMGWPAYVVSALRQLRYPAVHVEISVDGSAPVRRRARTVVIGNVGFLQAGIPLLPDARIDDGLLDIVVLAPRSHLGWLGMVWRVMGRRRRTDERLDRMTGRSVVIRAERPTPRQLDGDPVRPGSEIRAEVLAGTLLVRVPRPPR